MKRWHRRSIRLKNFDYTKAGIYYVTICTYERRHLFGEISRGKMILNKYGFIAEKEWKNTESMRNNIKLDYFIIMPDHIHGIIVITQNGRGAMHRAPTYEQFGKPVSGSIPTIIRGYKSAVTNKINKLRETPRKRVWQRNYHERIIRSEKELYNVRRYIKLNPLNWG